MAVTTADMRTLVTESNLNANNESFGNSRVDAAIRWAANWFMSSTKCVRTIGTKVTVSGTNTIDPSSMTTFLPGCLLSRPYIASEGRGLWVVELGQIIHQRNLSDASGIPEMIAFASDTVAHLYPNPDAVYTISFHYWLPFTAITLGGASVTLNIPDRYADDVAMGGAAHLIRGYPGHPDGPAKLAQFFTAVEKAKGEVSMAGVWFTDQNADYENSYARGGLA